MATDDILNGQQAEQEEALSAVQDPTESNTEEAQPAAEPRLEEGEDHTLLAQLEAARDKAEENWNELLRGRAEMDNLRKRHDRDIEKAHKFALEGFVKELLPVRDSLELGLSAAAEGAADADKLREGTEMTLNMLASALEKFSVEMVNPEGETFNPELHQAMTMQERDDVPANTVVTVVQKGYLLNGRLVRPAMVIVSSAAK